LLKHTSLHIRTGKTKQSSEKLGESESDELVFTYSNWENETVIWKARRKWEVMSLCSLGR